MSELKINFIVIGAQKCGTTSLAEILSKHPQISFCIEKEPSFFNKQGNWRDNIESYHKMFPKKRTAEMYGEASTMYTNYSEYPYTAQRIYEYNPDIKLIYVIRDPVERIKSQYTFYQIRHMTKHSIDREILVNREYIELSQYYTQLQPYLKYFNSDQILVLSFEEFISDTKKFLFQVSEFLNIDYKLFSIESTHKNKSEGVLYETQFIRILKKMLLIEHTRKIIYSNKKLIKLISFIKKHSYNKSSKPVLSKLTEEIILNFTKLDMKEINSFMLNQNQRFFKDIDMP